MVVAADFRWMAHFLLPIGETSEHSTGNADRSWILVDAALALWNLYHGFLLATVLMVVENPLKEPSLQLAYRMTRFLERHYMASTILSVSLFTLTANLGYQAMNHGQSGSSVTSRAIIAVYTWLSWLLAQKVTTRWLLILGPARLMDLEHDMEHHDIMHWRPPPRWIARLFEPQDWILRPLAIGINNIPTNRPSMMVINHSLHGLEMFPFFKLIWERKGFLPRALADHIHFASPAGEFMRFFGAVDGTRENVDCLMASKQNLLVYPGGAFEIYRHSSIPPYKLLWKNRLGFARCAIKGRYPVLPCASIGPDDMLKILYDLPLHPFKEGWTFPIVYPVWPHQLERVYIWFGVPISTEQYKGDWENDAFAREVRDKCKAAVEQGIQLLKERQANDPHRYMLQYIQDLITPGWLKQKSAERRQKVS